MEQLVEHELPVYLIDLQPNYPHYEEEYEDEEEDWVTEWDFSNQCFLCNKEINFYHRYYYKLSHSSRDYLFHKLCGDLPATLKHTSHCAFENASDRDLNHTLTLIQMEEYWWMCDICYSNPEVRELGYICLECGFFLHVKCAMRDEENPIIYHEMIYHPSHPHPLVVVNSKPISYECDACGKEHRGIFYNCTKCLCLSIHSDCLFLPRKLHTDHTHPLNLSYSFSKEEKRENFMPKCRICGFEFQREHLWIYKCEKCRYYAHLDCATSRKEPFMSSGVGKTIKNFKDVDHPNLVHLPFPDQTYSIWQLPFFSEKLLKTNEGGNLNHISHPHPLCLVTTSNNNFHNPMKKKEVLCNGCIRPIMTTPFYMCTKGCNFLLHEQCTRLPSVVENHPAHPQHPLVLILEPKFHRHSSPGFFCDNCFLFCNGFSYGCIKCKFFIDVGCAFIPEKITHESRPNHLLLRVENARENAYLRVDEAREISYCGACSKVFNPWSSEIIFRCNDCKFSLHTICALSYPSMMRHKIDKHPLKLSYLPIENHKSKYFCEVCEEELDPTKWFYHCQVCQQSIHCACISVIRRYEESKKHPSANVYRFLNIKFGEIYKLGGHPHSLSFAPGIKRDGSCKICGDSLEGEMIFKCFKCEFAIDYYCRQRLGRTLSL